MKLTFNVDNDAVTFERNATTGRAELRTREDLVPLQSPYRPSTHFSLRTSTAWKTQIGEHAIEVTRIRALLFGGIRASRYTVVVDGATVAEASGL